jgi:outer membrane cobalamin receptor
MHAQSAFADSVKSDTLGTQTVDTLRLSIMPIPLVGSIDRTLSMAHIVSDSTINFSDYSYVGELLRMNSGIFIRDLGSAGQLHGFTMNGIDARSIAFMSDGILLNEPLTGIFNPNLYPTETIDRIEVVSGTESFLYGFNSTGGAINFISKSKKAIHPYSRVRYSESGYGYSFVDGLVSQDIIRGLNFTTGAQHVTTDGRFPNSNYDAWNARFKIRYNISNTLNVYLSEIYNQTQLGLNGGVDTTTPVSLWFDRFQVVMLNTDSYEKITRHDLQLGAAAKLFPDSTAITTLTLYHSTNLREYRDEENRLASNSVLIRQDHRSQWFGTKLLQHIAVGNQQLDFGIETQSRGVIASPATGQRIETSTDIFGKTTFHIDEAVRMSAYARIDNYLERTPLSAGGDILFRPQSWVELFGGYSRSYRFPTIQELYWRDSVFSSVRSDFQPERHHLVEAGIRLSDQQSSTFELLFFRRTIWDAITLTPSQLSFPFRGVEISLQQKVILQGVNGTIEAHVGKFFVEGSAQYFEINEESGLQSSFPKWSATGGLYFWGKLAEGHLDLKVGIRGRAQSSYRGMEFNPQVLQYIPSTRADVDVVGTSDFIIIAHIGSAYVHIVWDNLLDRKYIVTPVYPMPERTLHFGISWEFTD